MGDAPYKKWLPTYTTNSYSYKNKIQLAIRTQKLHHITNTITTKVH